jgi:hypothetical protein
MKQKIFYCCCLLFVAVYAHGQRFNIGLQLNPTFAINSFNSNNDLVTRRNGVRIGLGGGGEANYYFSKKCLLNGFVNINRKSYNFEYKEFYGYLDDNSIFYDRLLYTSYEVGLLFGYKLAQMDKDRLYVYGGFDYALNRFKSEKPFEYYKRDGATKASQNVTYYLNPGSSGAGHITGSVNAVLAFNMHTLIKGGGLFEYGLRLFVPITHNTEEQQFRSQIVPVNGGEINTDATFRAKLYAVQANFAFYIFNFDHEMHMFELRNKERGLGENDDF